MSSRQELRLAVLGIAVGLLGLAWAVAERSWLLAGGLLAVIGVLLLLVYRPSFGSTGAFKPALSRGFKLVSHQSLDYEDRSSVHGYQVRFRPTRRFKWLRLRVTCDAVLLHARITIELPEDWKPEQTWVADPVRIEGNAATFEFAEPVVDGRFELFVEVNSSAPVRIENIQRLRGGPAPTLESASLSDLLDLPPSSTARRGGAWLAKARQGRVWFGLADPARPLGTPAGPRGGPAPRIYPGLPQTTSTYPAGCLLPVCSAPLPLTALTPPPPVTA